MKVSRFIATLMLGSIGLVGAAQAHDHAHEPKHGGIVTEVKDVDYELVAKSDAIHLYARDHGKSVDLSKATGKLTILVGAEKQEITLQGSKERLEATGTFNVPNGAKVVANVTLPGKSATSVRFSMK